MTGKQAAVAVLSLAFLAGAVGSARADNIDEKLLDEALSKIMKDLRSHKYQNVGVLKFRVQRGDRPSSYSASLLNANMATRLETALILVNDVKKPIGITRDASQVIAARDPKANYITPKDRAALFDYLLPLAWGTERVKVDAFLTGLVKINPASRRTTVVIEAFDPKATDLREVANFTVPTDRSILSDSGASFSLVMRDLVKKRGEELAEEAARYNDERDKKPLAQDPDAVENLVDLSVYYDDQKIPVVEDRNNAKGEKRVAEPPMGARVTFGLKNKTNERLAVVLRINGLNTAAPEGSEKQIDQYTRWVLEPGKPYVIAGFYREDGKTVDRFKVEASPAQKGALDPDKLGLIELDVFRSTTQAVASLKSEELSLRGLSAKTKGAKDLAELQLKLMGTTEAGKTARRNVIVGGDTEKTFVEETKFENPTHTGSMAIRYYLPADGN